MTATSTRRESAAPTACRKASPRTTGSRSARRLPPPRSATATAEAGSSPRRRAGADRRREQTNSCDAGSRGPTPTPAHRRSCSSSRAPTRPPTAPRQTMTRSSLSWEHAALVGNTLTCSTGGWDGAGRAVHLSFVDNADGRVLSSGPTGTFLLPSRAVGKQIVCDVAVSNAGGTTSRRPRRRPPSPARQFRSSASARSPRARKARRSRCLPADTARPAGTLLRLHHPPKSVGGKLCHSAANPDGRSADLPVRLQLPDQADSAGRQNAHRDQRDRRRLPATPARRSGPEELSLATARGGSGARAAPRSHADSTARRAARRRTSARPVRTAARRRASSAGAGRDLPSGSAPPSGPAASPAPTRRPQHARSTRSSASRRGRSRRRGAPRPPHWGRPSPTTPGCSGSRGGVRAGRRRA